MPIRITFDTTVTRLEAVKKAAYRFTDRCYVEITAAGTAINVSLMPKAGTPNRTILEGDFRNEVLDQELRESIAAESAPLRNLIIAQAFSATSLLDPAGETADFRDDPLNIATPDSSKR